jgi:hypothetical protein
MVGSQQKRDWLMNIFYQLRRGRVAKTDVIVELTLREILRMLLSREIRLEIPHDWVVLRYHGKA